MKSTFVASHLLLLVIALGEPPHALADSAEDWAKMKDIVPRGYICPRATGAVAIDGKLTKKEWGAAPWTEAFQDIEGSRKPKPRFNTRAKMMWDDKYFYVAALLQEPHVWGTLTKHDSVIFHDNDFEIFIDPDGDTHQYYEFEINALNTGWDLKLSRPYKNGGNADNGWEIPGLKTAVHVEGTLNEPSDVDRSWSVEIAMPWRVLAEYAQRPAPPREGDQWRVNFSRVQWRHNIEQGRYVKRPKLREDNWVWSPQGIIDMHRPERWGFVQFTRRPAESVKFAPDPAWPAREALMTVYHAAKGRYQRSKTWPNSLKQLELPPNLDRQLAQPILFSGNQDGFQAEAVIKIGNRRERYRIRQDSKLWRVRE